MSTKIHLQLCTIGEIYRWKKDRWTNKQYVYENPFAALRHRRNISVEKD